MCGLPSRAAVNVGDPSLDRDVHAALVLGGVVGWVRTLLQVLVADQAGRRVSAVVVQGAVGRVGKLLHGELGTLIQDVLCERKRFK